MNRNPADLSQCNTLLHSIDLALTRLETELEELMTLDAGRYRELPADAPDMNCFSAAVDAKSAGSDPMNATVAPYGTTGLRDRSDMPFRDRVERQIPQHSNCVGQLEAGLEAKTSVTETPGPWGLVKTWAQKASLGIAPWARLGQLNSTSSSPDFASGQLWRCAGRGDDETPTLLINRVDRYPRGVEIFHLTLRGLQVRHPGLPSGMLTTLPHVPVTRQALELSQTRFERLQPPDPDYLQGYMQWKQSFDAGRAGSFEVSLAEVLDIIERGVSDTLVR